MYGSFDTDLTFVHMVCTKCIKVLSHIQKAGKLPVCLLYCSLDDINRANLSNLNMEIHNWTVLTFPGKPFFSGLGSISLKCA